MTVLYFIIVAIVSYLIGTVNFSKILAWNIKQKDITKLGSGNPGSMNMLRSFGFVMGIFTFLAEAVKAGLVCLISSLVLPEFASVIYYYAGAFVLLGYNFPVWTKFKGGKGVACFAGIFLFSHVWYVALIWFAVCFILFLFIQYGSVMSFLYLGGNAIATTIYIWVVPIDYAWAITIIVWLLMILTIVRHRSNIIRLANGTESKIDFKEILKQVFRKKKGEEIISEEEVKQEPEKEIVIEEDEGSKKLD